MNRLYQESQLIKNTNIQHKQKKWPERSQQKAPQLKNMLSVTGHKNVATRKIQVNKNPKF